MASDYWGGRERGLLWGEYPHITTTWGRKNCHPEKRAPTWGQEPGNLFGCRAATVLTVAKTYCKMLHHYLLVPDWGSSQSISAFRAP